MIQRSDTLVYVKRFYIFPFKPLMDYEYKKFGYKKCDIDRRNHPFFNTAYYVCHKERPTNSTFSLCYGLNFILSLCRTILFPIMLAIFFLSLLIEGTLSIDCLLSQQILLLVLHGPLVLLTVFLSNTAYKISLAEGFDEKADRALKSRGWAPWTSYTDNDPRFCPPGMTTSQNASACAHQQPVSQKMNVKEDDSEPTIVLQAANGENIEFSLIASIPNRGKTYVLLTPIQPLEGLAEDEALVFEYKIAEDGSPNYVIEQDDTIVDEVMDSYEQLLNDAN